jgi:hypothetical protein
VEKCNPNILPLEDLTPSFYLVMNVLGIQTTSLKGQKKGIDYERLLPLPFDFDLPPILALHIAYGFLPPPLRFTFVTHLSNFLVLRPFFLPCGIVINCTTYLIKDVYNVFNYLFI